MIEGDIQFFLFSIIQPLEFTEWKVEMMEWSGLERDALHVYIGTLLFLALYAALGTRCWGRLAALLIVAVGAYWGECMDYSQEGVKTPLFETGDHLHDLINTMALPVVLYLLGGLIFARTKKPRTKGEADLLDAEIEGER